MIKRILVAYIVIIIGLNMTYSWKYDRHPNGPYGEKLQFRFISPRNRRVQKRIVMLHDFFRTKVNPPASNMLSMKWHHGAQKSAQKWAAQCYFLVHDSPKGRWQNNYGACGQNIFVSTHKVPWLFALRTWFLERNNFTYDYHRNELRDVGHYTQMIWAITHKVGCGIAKCPGGGPKNKPFYNYVCNYCPIGNRLEKLGTPYKKGKPCSACAHSCNKKISLCTNYCMGADLWANCSSLHKIWSGWLCRTNTTEGLERRRNCFATCNCAQRKLMYDNDIYD